MGEKVPKEMELEAHMARSAECGWQFLPRKPLSLLSVPLLCSSPLLLAVPHLWVLSHQA